MDAGERVAKVMARAGVCSRREAETWIKEGRVAVNGETLASPARNVTAQDRITIDGEPMQARQRTRLFRYHKPKGMLTTNHDPEGRPTIYQHLPEGLPRLISIGRLDYNTEGLLLLTNDGGLARLLELPETGWLRRYRVRAFGTITQTQLDALAQGITVDGMEYGALDAKLDRVQGENVWLTIGIREGKNREVRKVLEALGLHVNRLIRVSYGPFQLFDLAENAIEEVRTRVLQDQLGETLSTQAGCDFTAEIPAAAVMLQDGPRHRRDSDRQKSDTQEKNRQDRPQRKPQQRSDQGRSRRSDPESDRRPAREEKKHLRPRSGTRVWRDRTETSPESGAVLKRRRKPEPDEKVTLKRAGVVKDSQGRRIVVSKTVRSSEGASDGNDTARAPRGKARQDRAEREGRDARTRSPDRNRRPREDGPYQKKPFSKGPRKDRPSTPRSEDRFAGRERGAEATVGNRRPGEDGPYQKKPFGKGPRRQTTSTPRSEHRFAGRERGAETTGGNRRPREDGPYQKKPFSKGPRKDRPSTPRSEDRFESRERGAETTGGNRRPREDGPYQKKPFGKGPRKDRPSTPRANGRTGTGKPSGRSAPPRPPRGKPCPK